MGPLFYDRIVEDGGGGIQTGVRILYAFLPLLQNLLTGDLLPLQSQILDSTVRRRCHLQISQFQGAEADSTDAPTCSN